MRLLQNPPNANFQVPTERLLLDVDRLLLGALRGQRIGPALMKQFHGPGELSRGRWTGLPFVPEPLGFCADSR